MFFCHLKINMSRNKVEARMSNHFTDLIFYGVGCQVVKGRLIVNIDSTMSYKVVNGRLIINIDSTEHIIEIRTDSSGFAFFSIYNNRFWVKKVHNHENTTEYKVSNIVQHNSNESSQKVSDLFIDVYETDYISVVVSHSKVISRNKVISIDNILKILCILTSLILIYLYFPKHSFK